MGPADKVRDLRCKKITSKLQTTAKRLLSSGEVDIVIGFTEGELNNQSVPAFIKSEEEADKLVFNNFL